MLSFLRYFTSGLGYDVEVMIGRRVFVSVMNTELGNIADSMVVVLVVKFDLYMEVEEE